MMDNVELIHELEIWNEPDGAILFDSRLKGPVPTFSVGQEFEFNGQKRYVWGFFPRVGYSEDRTKLYLGLCCESVKRLRQLRTPGDKQTEIL